jgi:SAM-dependent methyltransferase
MRLRSLSRHLRPRYLRDSRFGTCTVCGRRSLFVFTGSIDTVRNHAVCVRCGSCSRQRHLAWAVLQAFADRGVRRLADFESRPEFVLYDTCSQGTLARAAGPRVLRSEFYDDVPRGESRDGVLSQDLRRLTFADASLDLIVSEDVFEHIPEYPAAFREVHRVLKPGGHHIFTIPFYFDRRTRELFEWRNGEPVLFEPIEYHGDPIRGELPCFTHFGYDLLDFLREIGFEVRLEISSLGNHLRHGTFDSYTLITRKP